MKKKLMILFVLGFLFMGCAKESEPQLVGGDRDAHGCIPSAGYSWCERTKQCERPWELAKEYGFPNTSEGFTEFCAGE